MAFLSDSGVTKATPDIMSNNNNNITKYIKYGDDNYLELYSIDIYNENHYFYDNSEVYKDVKYRVKIQLTGDYLYYDENLNLITSFTYPDYLSKLGGLYLDMCDNPDQIASTITKKDGKNIVSGLNTLNTNLSTLNDSLTKLKEATSNENLIVVLTNMTTSLDNINKAIINLQTDDTIKDE